MSYYLSYTRMYRFPPQTLDEIGRLFYNKETIIPEMMWQTRMADLEVKMWGLYTWPPYILLEEV